MVTAIVFAGKSVATAAISFLVNKAFGYLDECCKSEGMEEVKNRLRLALPKIEAVFNVVNPEIIREQSSALDAWLWQLRDAVEEAEDAIDELEYYELEEKAKDRKVSDWGSSFAKMKHKVVRSVQHASILDKSLKKFTHHVTLKRLMTAVDTLDKAAAGVASFLTLTDHLKGVASSSQQQAQLLNNDRETCSTLSATTFVGREKEKEQIIRWLTQTSVESVTSTHSVPIISVLGHGGMGKTTLAQRICEEKEVLKHFKVIWVTISTSFDATVVTSKILECATGAKPRANHLEPLQKNLKKRLKSSNFLLVLDDVWEDEKRDEWEKLFAPLRKMNTGSKILVTTRMRSVADMAASVMGVERDLCLTLGVLAEDENIVLFNHHVFSGLNPQDYVHLKLLGDQIARKLGGCPLVTKIVGGHLQGNITLEYWSRFLHERLEHFKGTEEDIMKVLRLSYYHLPTELQICFRYCSLFPEDYEFEKKELMQLWIGSGLISQVASDSLTLEDTGEQLLARLTRKSFFDMKSIQYANDGSEAEYYVLHDLMHELARNVSTGECARITDPARFEDVKDTVRHLSVACIHRFSVEDVKKISHFKNLRTIIFDDNEPEVDKDMIHALGKIVESSRSLRLFHSRLRKTFHFADKFGNLKHLRYIYLHQLSPEGIRGVVKHYHLMLLHCQLGLQRKPKQVTYLGYLEHLRYVSYGVLGLGAFPISRLTSLQELYNYRVEESISNKISAIRSLRGLRTLQVNGLENVENYEEIMNANLNEKQYLNSLSLGWSVFSGAQTRTEKDELALDHFEPHGNIRVLEIFGYEGIRLPFWIENLSVKNLVSLRLKNCINWDHLPSLGEFVLLKHIRLENLPKLQQIGQSSARSSSSSMELLLPPSLSTLEVLRCQELKELPILPPSLVSLRIEDAGLTTLPMIGKIFSEGSETKPSQLLNISVIDCLCLTSVEGSLLQQTLYMGALLALIIKNCLHLESASIPFEEMNELTKLDISGYPKLRTVRDAKDKLLPSSLTEVSMGQCGDLDLCLLASMSRLSYLCSLVLENCSGLVSLPSADVFMSLKLLRSMQIWGCKKLSSLGGLGSIAFLVSLDIIDCGNLVEAGSPLTSGASADEEEHLVEPSSSLQISNLYIDLPSLLLVEPLKSLCHTECLIIRDGSEMDSLLERWLLQNRSSLRALHIEEVKSLESIPLSMRDLSSLKELQLTFAARLQSLPHLPFSLQNLCIEQCDSELEKKSREFENPESNKISHILRVQIGGLYFIMGKECSRETYYRLRFEDDNMLLSWANQQKGVKRLHWWKKPLCSKQMLTKCFSTT